jgi:integrase
MTESHSTQQSPPRKVRSRKPKKPAKPYPNFPLFPHATKRWAKKIRGKLHFFGSWAHVVKGELVRVEDDGWEAALELYETQAKDLHAGKTPRVLVEGLQLHELASRFLSSKRHLLDTRELAAQSFQDYKLATDCIIDNFGRDRLVNDLGPDDFEALRATMAAQWGPVRLGNTIQRVRSVFKFGYDAGLIERPLRFGPSFKRPSRKTLRLERNKGGKRMFEPEEIHAMLAKAGVQLRAMILLGVNVGLGNSDCGTLEMRHLDLDGGWLNFPRGKTGVNRRAKLWVETAAAIRAALANRPKPKNETDAGLVFVTQRGGRWVKTAVHEEKDSDEKATISVTCDDAVAKETKKILKKLGIIGRRGFYCLRHTTQTIGDEARDPVAVDAILGHVDSSMAGHYRERLSDERLERVADTIHNWLFSPALRIVSSPVEAERVG